MVVFNWFANSGTFTGLGAGTYNVFIRNDDTSCVTAHINNPINLSVPTSPSITNVATTESN